MKFRMTLPQKALLPVLIAYYSMNFMDRSVLGIVGEAMKQDMGFTDAQLGLLHSILLIALILLIFPCSIINDLLKRRKVIGFCAGIWAAGMALTASATGFLSLIFARILGSANEASTGAGGTAWLSTMYPPEKRGKVLGMFQMAAPLGMALGTLLGGGVLSLTGNWRIAFAIFVLPAIAAAIIVPMLPDDQAPSKGNFFSGLPRVFRLRTILLGALATGFFSIIKYSYQAWMPVLLIRSYSLEPQYAGPMAACFLLVGAAGPFLGGLLADFWAKRDNAGRVKAAAALLFLIVLSKTVFYCCLGRVSLPAICVLGVIDGIILMMPIPVYFSFIQDVAEPQYRSTAIGLFGTLVFLMGGAWGPLLVGLLSDAFGGGADGLLYAMASLLLFAFLSGCIYLLTVRWYLKEKQSA